MKETCINFIKKESEMSVDSDDLPMEMGPEPLADGGDAPMEEDPEPPTDGGDALMEQVAPEPPADGSDSPMEEMGPDPPADGGDEPIYVARRLMVVACPSMWSVSRTTPSSCS
jgi:hypothetical protein